MTIIDNTAVSKMERRMFGFDLDSWNSVMVASLGFAAVAALAVVVSTAIVIKLQKAEERATKQEFELYKVAAGEKISTANAIGEAAKADSEKARAEVEKAHADITKANAAIAQADARAAEAGVEQERLKQIVSWRALSPAALATLTDSLRGGGSANLTYAANDPEALYFWTQISKAFPKPSWTLVGQARTYEGTFHAGIFINGPDTQDTRTIRNAFTAAGIPFGAQELGEPHMFFGDPPIPNVPTVFIASRFPPNR